MRRNGVNAFIVDYESRVLDDMGYRRVPLGSEKILYYNPKLFDLITDMTGGFVGIRVRWDKIPALMAQLEPPESGPPDHIGGDHV